MDDPTLVAMAPEDDDGGGVGTVVGGCCNCCADDMFCGSSASGGLSSSNGAKPFQSLVVPIVPIRGTVRGTVRAYLALERNTVTIRRRWLAGMWLLFYSRVLFMQCRLSPRTQGARKSFLCIAVLHFLIATS